ncbi:MAG: SDR family oxidoreductase [Parvibaculum sp.]|nr:SDR family oxidoreductase [Parvibaculum sp.]
MTASKRLAGRTAIVVGSSRGIGFSVAQNFAAEGANVALLAKTGKSDSRRQGTIFDAADRIAASGGIALPLMADIRDEGSVARAVDATVSEFGGIDIVVNNASAIDLTDTASIPISRFDLMHHVNVRGTFVMTQACLPHLVKSDAAHVIVMAPPLSRMERIFLSHVPYSLTKFGMSLCVLGWHHEFGKHGICVNALWPRTLIATAALRMLSSEDLSRHARKPEIVAAAALEIVLDSTRPSGHFLIDEDVLRARGVTDFEQYAVDPLSDPIVDYT